MIKIKQNKEMTIEDRLKDLTERYSKILEIIEKDNPVSNPKLFDIIMPRL